MRLDDAGADALVLFNRFPQPSIDPETLAIVPAVALSSPVDALLPQRWIALLRGMVRAALAATSGVEDSADVATYLLAGADVVMTASALLRHGPEHATVLLDGLSAWMARKGFESVDALICQAASRRVFAYPTCRITLGGSELLDHHQRRYLYVGIGRGRPSGRPFSLRDSRPRVA